MSREWSSIIGLVSPELWKVDMLCIAESWIHAPEQLSGLQVPGFTEYVSLCSNNYVARPYGGLLLYISTSILH